MGRAAQPTPPSYRPLAVRLAPGARDVRYLYIRAHKSEHAPAESEGHTLFVAAVPASYGLSGLRALLSCFGGILSCTEVRLASLPAPAAHVCFATAKGLARALEAASEDLEPLEPPPEEACEVAGLTAWVAAHRAARPGLAALQAQLDEWVAADEAASEAAARASEAAAAGEEGWTVVGRKQGRRKTAAGDAEGTTVGSVAPAKARSKATLKGPMVTHGDFYRFQRHEKQRDAVLELREKFKADTQRIAELRKQRAFKPY